MGTRQQKIDNYALEEGTARICPHCGKKIAAKDYQRHVTSSECKDLAEQKSHTKAHEEIIERLDKIEGFLVL